MDGQAWPSESLEGRGTLSCESLVAGAVEEVRRAGRAAVGGSERVPRVAVLVSGGVDSSVALRLVQAAGCDVTAFYIKIWLEDDLAFLAQGEGQQEHGESGGGGPESSNGVDAVPLSPVDAVKPMCPWESDVAEVRAVCEQANVKFEVVSLQREYWEGVIEYTVAEASKGRTPNPDVVCNSRIKFGTFLERFGDDFDLVASGHYARIREEEGGEEKGRRKVSLVASPDAFKDQTYFLCNLSQVQLSRLVFPIGVMPKSEVRRLAQHFELPNASRPDSQGLCFLGKVRFRDFLREHIADAPGDIVDVDTGAVVGQHLGVHLHTHGQRSGLGLSGGPWYVVDKVAEKNEVRVSRRYYEDDGRWHRDWLEVDDVNWPGGAAPEGVVHGVPTRELRVKLRHGPSLETCTCTFFFGDGTEGGQHRARATVQLDKRDQGIAPGQFAVFYDGQGACVAAGPIAAGGT